MTTRRLAAILAADMVGYSRLMGADEEGTLARLQALRQQIIDPSVAKSGGRVVKTTGDGILAEFPSAVEAVRCALDMQEQTRAREAAHAPGQRLEFRVGINVGDVIASDDDIHGDGVNVAARLEGLADPGGILVSATVHATAAGRLACTFEDLGEQALKNIVQPVRAYRVTPPTPNAERPALALPDKPSIAVLPFQNMSGDPEQEYFADGMVEEIITGLSRVRAFFVIARNSSFAYKGKSPDVRQVGRELGVRYVLEGSVRKAGNRVRITGQLVDATSGTHLWADRFDGALEDVFDLQDRVTGSVVSAIEPKIRSAEIERAQRKPTENLQAYDLALRALPHMYSFSRERVEEANRLLRQATEIDPTYALAFARRAICLYISTFQGWTPPTKLLFDEIIRLVRIALEHGGADPEVLAEAAGLTGTVGGDLHGGIALAEKALALNPNSITALNRSGNLHAYAGNTDTAIDRLQQAARLNPVQGSGVRQHFTAEAHFLAGRYEAAVEFEEKALRDNPNTVPIMRVLAASLGLLGRIDEAQEAARRMRAIAPELTIARVRTFLEMDSPSGSKRRGMLDVYCEGLRRAGLPE